MNERHILLKMSCKKAGNCCGAGKLRNRFSVLTIEEVDGEWIIKDCTPTTTNILQLSKKQTRIRKPAWAGSVHNMNLHKDKKFVAQLKEKGLFTDGCEVIE